jgi:4-phytase / acid phosphatase
MRLAPAALVLPLLLPAVRLRAAAPPEQVRLVVIVTRHGVRSPLPLAGGIGQYAAQGWPRWEVPPGILTPHGAQEMADMGYYYRERLVAQGVLSGNPALDLARVYFQSDNDERCEATAREMAMTLLPGRMAVVHALPEGRADPLFLPAKVPVGRPDRARAVAAILGRMGGDPAALGPVIRPNLEALEGVLLGGKPPPPGKVSILGLPSAVREKPGDTLATTVGPLHLGDYFAEYFLLEYEDGMPLSQVGWGRVDGAMLTRLMQLHELDWEYELRTFYVAQAQGSNLASHVLQTLEQAATGRPVPGAIGTPADRVVVLAGHDTNIANLGGLLGLSWIVPGSWPNPQLPGGALVFELRRREGAWYVRTLYIAQTPEDVRAGRVPTLKDPPAIAPIFVPGCSGARPGYGAPLAAFAARVRAAVDPRFVDPSSD